MPTYEHLCPHCDFHWESRYSITTAPPKNCPECGKEGAKRLISATVGRVELTGHEYKASIKEGAAKMVVDASENENSLANLVGEDKYHKARLG